MRRSRSLIRRSGAIVVAALLVGAVWPMAVAAAPPPNDEWPDATVIDVPSLTDPDGEVVLDEVVDIVDATEGPDDPTVCESSSGTSLATLWYQITLAFDGRVKLHASRQDAQLHVGTRTADSFTWQACVLSDAFDAHLLFHAEAGVPYYVVASGLSNPEAPTETRFIVIADQLGGAAPAPATPPPTDVAPTSRPAVAEDLSAILALVVGALTGLLALTGRRPRRDQGER